MATKKTTTKTKSKKVTTDFKVDLTTVNSGSEVYAAIADAKCDKFLTNIEYLTLISDIVNRFGINITFCNCNNCIKPTKKPNVFKRFWNWITRKK